MQAEDSPLTSTERAIAVAHGLAADEDGSRCFPGAYTVAKRTAFNVKTVEKVRTKLERDGWLVCSFKGGTDRGGLRLKSEYRLSVPKGRSAPPADNGWLDGPPAEDDAPPAHDPATTRCGEALPTQDQPVTNPAGPPADDGRSDLDPAVIEVGLAAIAALREAS